MGKGKNSAEFSALRSLVAKVIKKLGKSLAEDGRDAVKIIEDVDLIDMELEREVFDPLSGEVDMNEEDGEPMRVLESEEHAITLREVGDVDDKEPPSTPTHIDSSQRYAREVVCICE